MADYKLYNDDVLSGMSKISDSSVDCVITSPPYWQLRDYKWDGQWGLEPTFQQYLEHLWQFMDECHRVLKPEGTVWVNLGDTYSGSGNDSGKKVGDISQQISGTKVGLANPMKAQPKTGLPNKCLLLIPHRFAIGCEDPDYELRDDLTDEEKLFVINELQKYNAL